MKMTIEYRNLDGTTFEGPLFHPHLETASLDGKRHYMTKFDEFRRPVYRVELAVDENGWFVQPGDI